MIESIFNIKSQESDLNNNLLANGSAVILQGSDFFFPPSFSSFLSCLISWALKKRIYLLRMSLHYTKLLMGSL